MEAGRWQAQAAVLTVQSPHTAGAGPLFYKRFRPVALVA